MEGVSSRPGMLWHAVNQTQPEGSNSIRALGTEQTLMSAVMHQGKAATEQQNHQHQQQGCQHDRCDVERCCHRRHRNPHRNDRNHGVQDLPARDPVITGHKGSEFEVDPFGVMTRRHVLAHPLIGRCHAASTWGAAIGLMKEPICFLLQPVFQLPAECRI